MEVDDVSVVLYHGEGGERAALCALECVDPVLKFDTSGLELRLQQQYTMFGSGEAGVENDVRVSEFVRPYCVAFELPRLLDKAFKVGLCFS
jgi:hypothetical protein